MIDITARARAYWESVAPPHNHAECMTDASAEDCPALDKVKALVIAAFEQGWMQHNVH